MLSVLLWQALYLPARRMLYSIIGINRQQDIIVDLPLGPSLKHKNSDIIPEDDRVDEDQQPFKLEAEDFEDHVVSLPSPTLGQQKKGYVALEPLGNEALQGMEAVTSSEVVEEAPDTESYTLWQCVQSFDFW
jgi:hypothetical protein